MTRGRQCSTDRLILRLNRGGLYLSIRLGLRLRVAFGRIYRPTLYLGSVS
jgi:hypothetical protein